MRQRRTRRACSTRSCGGSSTTAACTNCRTRRRPTGRRRTRWPPPAGWSGRPSPGRPGGGGAPVPRPPLRVPAAFAGFALLLSACGGAGVTTLSAPPTTDTSLTLTLQHSPVGPILDTGGGDTLYDFVPDTPTHSACLNDGCVFQWPPLIDSGAVRLGKGLDRALVGTLRRPD